MPTLPEIAERISNLPSGGMTTSVNELDRPYLYSLIHAATAMAKRNDFAKTKKVHQSWYFPLNITVDMTQQVDSGCYFRYPLPQIIGLDGRQMGLGYAGTIVKNQGFRVTVGRAAFASQQADRVMRVRDSKTDLLIENDYFELYGKLARKVRLEAAWADVTEITSFNIEKDQYPVNIDLIPEIERIITQTDLLIITKSFADRMSNLNRVADAPIVQ